MRWRMMILVLGVCVCMSLIQVTCEAGEIARRPNIVVFVVDDLGEMDIEPNNPQTFYETPHIKQLAAEGMRFTQGYAACQVCSPTRYSLMTGRSPVRAACTDWFGANRAEKFQPADYVPHMPLNEITLAQAVKEHGYQTFFLGKWHLGESEEYWPEARGFDVNLGGYKAGHPVSYFSPYKNPRLSDGPDGEYLTDRLAEEACELIANHDEQPFFLYLCFYNVHTPLQAPAELVEKYQAKAKALGISDAQLKDDQKYLEEEQHHQTKKPRVVRQIQNHPVYAGMVEKTDTAVGRILGQLKASGVEDDTLVVFTSDNGGLSTSEGSPTSNVPFRGGKGWGYEGGIRVPWIIKWPGHTKPGDVNTTPIISADLYPTVLEIAGLPLKPEQHLDGVSLKPLLNGQTIDRQTMFWHYPHYGNQGGYPCTVVRYGDFKLLIDLENGDFELFDLKQDPQEQKNIAEAHPDVVSDLKNKAIAFYDQTQARFLQPKKNSAEEPWQPR